MTSDRPAQTLDATPAGPTAAPPLGGPARGGTLPAAGAPGLAGLESIRALTVLQPFASLIVAGIKQIETRRWATSFRGPLLICAGKQELGSIQGLDRELGNRLAQALWRRPLQPGDELPLGVAVGVVEVIDCRPMRPQDWPAACCEAYEPAYGLVCTRAYRIKPFAVRGQQRLFHVPVTKQLLARI